MGGSVNLLTPPRGAIGAPDKVEGPVADSLTPTPAASPAERPRGRHERQRRDGLLQPGVVANAAQEPEAHAHVRERAGHRAAGIGGGGRRHDHCACGIRGHPAYRNVLGGRPNGRQCNQSTGTSEVVHPGFRALNLSKATQMCKNLKVAPNS